MDERVKQELARYGVTIQRHGWDAGEALIREHELAFPEFRRWAHALGIMLRARELLEQPGCDGSTLV